MCTNVDVFVCAQEEPDEPEDDEDEEQEDRPEEELDGEASCQCI